MAYASFSDCVSLENLILPKNLNRVESHAFGNCSGMSYIVFHDKPAYMFENIFSGSTDLDIYVVPESIGWEIPGEFQGNPVSLAPVPDQ